MSQGLFRRQGPTFALIVLVLAAFLVFFAGTSGGDIHSFDSLMLCTVARIVVDTGDWVTLRYPDAQTPWYHHPPLGIWGISVGFLLTGVTTLGARLFSAACGFGATLVAAGIGWKVRGPWAGFLSGAVLMGTPYFVKMSRRPRLDAPLSFFIALAVLGILIAERKRWGWALFGVATGLGILTKGIVGLAPLGMAPLILILLGRWRWGRLSFWGGCLLALAVPIPWVILHARAQGGAILEPYFVERVWGAIRGTWPDPRGPHYYFWIGLQVGLPWFPLGLYGLCRIGARAWKGLEPGAIPVLVWGAAIIIPFSLVRHKHAYYLMPFLPPMAVATGIVLDGWLREGVKRALASGLGVAFVAAVLIIPLVEIPFQRERLQDIRGLRGAILEVTEETDAIHAYRMPPMRTEAAIAFYGERRPGEFFQEPERLRDAVRAEEVRFLYARRRDWDELKGIVQGGEVIREAEGSVFVRFGGR